MKALVENTPYSPACFVEQPAILLLLEHINFIAYIPGEGGSPIVVVPTPYIYESLLTLVEQPISLVE